MSESAVDPQRAVDAPDQGEPRPAAEGRAPSRPLRRVWLWVAAGALALIVVYNLAVWMPASRAIGADGRNDGVGLHVYRTWLVHPTDITVDLVTVENVAPVDLMRALFQSSAALKDREFGQVTLARRGKPVFRMTGDDFSTLGAEYAAGQNPVYLIRTLPQQLYRPDGGPAFETWQGGWLGVMTRQMEDVNRFGQAWVDGEAPLPGAYTFR